MRRCFRCYGRQYRNCPTVPHRLIVSRARLRDCEQRFGDRRRWQRKLSDQARGVDEAFSGNEFGYRITVDHKTHRQRVIHSTDVERRGRGRGDKSHAVRTSFSSRCRIGTRHEVVRGFLMVKRKCEFQWTGLDAIHIEYEDNIELN